jgi:hypothetical protein
MPRVGFEPTNPVFERAKTVHALDRAAAVIGRSLRYLVRIKDKSIDIPIHNLLHESLGLYCYTSITTTRMSKDFMT